MNGRRTKAAPAPSIPEGHVVVPKELAARDEDEIFALMLIRHMGTEKALSRLLQLDVEHRLVTFTRQMHPLWRAGMPEGGTL